MSKRRRHAAENGHHETNMTPLIDVSLVLVVILLLATPLAFESSIALRSAARNARAAPDEVDVGRVELVLVSEDEVRVNRKVVARAALGETLRPLFTAGPRRVAVSCADTVSHGAFVDVLDQAKLSGAVEIGVVGR